MHVTFRQLVVTVNKVAEKDLCMYTVKSRNAIFLVFLHVKMCHFYIEINLRVTLYMLKPSSEWVLTLSNTFRMILHAIVISIPVKTETVHTCVSFVSFYCGCNLMLQPYVEIYSLYIRIVCKAE